MDSLRPAYIELVWSRPRMFLGESQGWRSSAFVYGHELLSKICRNYTGRAR